MRDLVALEGYGGVTVSAVIARAGVSRPTFYEYFPSKDDCFAHSLAPIRRRILRHVTDAVAREEPSLAARGFVEGLLAFVSAEPDGALLLLAHALGGGAASLDARDASVDELAGVIETAYRAAPAGAPLVDLAPELLVGGALRLLASRLPCEVAELSGVRGELLAWLASYARPAGELEWFALAPSVPPPAWPYLPRAPLCAPGPPRGRRRPVGAALHDDRRQRILFATAQVVRERGYEAATVSEITACAGLDGRAFYGLFADKQQALLAAHELLFRNAIAVTAGAFVTGQHWPERLWHAARALSQFLERNGTLAHVTLIDGYAAGPGVLRRLEVLVRAFLIFLQEGSEERARDRGAREPSPVVLDAIAMTVVELLYRQFRRAGEAEVSRLAPHAVFIALAPFLGAAPAAAFLRHISAET